MPKTLVTPRTPPPVHLHFHKTLRDSYRQLHPVETEVLMAKDLYIFCRATGNQIATTHPSSPRAATHLWNDLPAEEAVRTKSPRLPGLGGSESAGHAVPLAEEDVPAWNAAASVGKHELRAWKAASLAAERVTAMDSWVTGSVCSRHY